MPKQLLSVPIDSLQPTVPTESLIEDFKISARTSIARSSPSAPLKQLLKAGLIKGSVLNYGKGRTSQDSDAINKVAFCHDYDYVYAPFPELLGNSYDTVFSAFVVNTLPPAARDHVWKQMASVCKGKAYIAARSSTDRGLKGVREQDGLRTLRSTFQKGYQKNELKQEAQQYFASVREIPTKGAFRLVECSHDFLEVTGNSTQLSLVQ
ncbi:class I SAM-dependent methyltransferase [Vibrio vulnificus]|nr:class I SAM-dependent methyltransferase [Vibrio vulnificus]MDF5646591.1 class I SAM-dependent methyltransferase [Vibrio parahaemolyticus]BDP38367.1 hypothetical protein VA208B3_47380 [Vibrio alginolyticus]MDF5666151.1 class I SAM-dependent methyltransferase [Vibrio parahaemolyticus]WKV19404.1 hypothetical protein [Vibrio parahaemolyticus]BDP33389.1 hypothetical protein VV208B2_44690 [Vibrio vulnificus]